MSPRDPGGPDGQENPPPPPQPPPPPPPPPSDPDDPSDPPDVEDPTPPDEPEDDPPTTPSDDPEPPAEPETPEEDPPTTPSEDPEPPAPPSTPAGPGAPVTGAPVPKGGSAGGSTGGSKGLGAGSGRRARTAAKKADVMTTWRGWWAVNDRALLPERADDLRTTTPSPDDEALFEGHRVRRELAVRREILPVLHGILAPDAKINDLLRRTALLALGKVAQTEGDTALLVHWLADEKASAAVRDAAALGVGLLCRTEEGRQFEPWVLDALRSRLVRLAGDARTSESLRATCAISLGLLGNQPFGAGIHKDGRLVTRQLWRTLKERGSHRDLSVAMLTALGMQPSDGVPDGVEEALNDVVWGRALEGRRLDGLERSHALTALARLGGPRAITVPLRVLQSGRMPAEVRRAALIGLGRVASRMSEDERRQAAAAIRRAIPRSKDPLTRGLAFVAVGRLVSAQATAGDRLVRDMQSLWHLLVAEARTGAGPSRGFAILGLGLAARPQPGDGAIPAPLRRVYDEAEEILLKGLESERGDADRRGAYATALGIMGARSAVPVLVGCVEERNELAVLRSDAAVSLGHIGHDGPEVIRALNIALSETRLPRVQAGAALGLSLLRGPTAGRRLLRELEHSMRSTDVVRLTEPLGYLGDPALARPLIDYVASNQNADFPRALMVVALGNLGDPERRPSLARLGEDANYPDAPPALRDTLFTR